MSAKNPQRKRPAKIGRPTDYTPEIGREICERLMEGIPLTEICEDSAMPGRTTVHGWLAKGIEEEAADGKGIVKAFPSMYARAREVQQHTLVELGHSAVKETYERTRAGEATKEEVSAAREYFHGIQWLAGKLAPKTYGDTATMRVAGHDGKALRVEHGVAPSLEAAILAATAQRRALAAREIDGECEEIDAPQDDEAEDE